MSLVEHEPCADWTVMMHGFIDGELDAAHALAFEQHLTGCARCREETERFRALRRVVGQQGVRWRAPDHVRAQIMDALKQESLAGRRAASLDGRAGIAHILRAIGQWSLIPSMAALAASVFLLVTNPRDPAGLETELISSHVRSLLVDHLTDVQTSDQHTVKPWFAGKIDFSPPIVDLTAQGFPLVGGRVDYLAGRVVAAVVYRRHGHIINLFVWPSPPAATSADVWDGYNLAQWSSGGLTFRAVSDVSAKEIETFRELFIRQSES